MAGFKKKLIWAICVVLLFVPTYIGVWSYFSARRAPVREGAVTRLELTDLNGTIFTFTTDSLEEEFEGGALTYFLNLNEKSKPVGSLPQQLTFADYFKAVYYSYDLATTYRYYFSADPDSSYFVDGAGKAYKIPADIASKFIQSSYGMCLFPASTPPTMNFGDGGVVILPAEMTWQCLSYGNVYKEVEVPTSTQTQKITILGGLDLRFTVEPDYMLVNIKRDGLTVYDDLYENISSFNFEEGASFNVTITAKWYENKERGAFGEAVYEFVANVKPAPVFYLGCGGVTQTLSIAIEPKTFRSKDVTVSTREMASKFTHETVEEFNNIAGQYLAAESEARYWEGKFIEGVAGRYITAGFGIYRKKAGAYGTGETYRNPGVDYIVNAGDKALAANNGKVIYVGELAWTGKTVIIDHGLGLKSLYAYLGDVSVKVGDMVKTGDTIGTVGTTGFTSGYGFQYRLYVHNIPVCPYSLWEQGIPMTE